MGVVSTSVLPMLNICLANMSLSTRPLLPELSPDAEETPLVVDRVEMVDAALDPTWSCTAPPLLAKGRRELWISAIAFW